jgi:DNA polymerase elongation subunit (family B)
MYQAIFYEYPNKFYLRDDEKGWVHFEHEPTYFRIDPNGKYPTLDGKMASPTKKYVKDDPDLYERDVDPKTRLLIELYGDSDETPKFQKLVYFDIECEIAGALTPELIKYNPQKTTSISLYCATQKKYYCLILDEDEKLNEIKTNTREVIPFASEKELLSAFLELWEALEPTIITGWNSGFFDVPFLYYRISKVLGEKQALRLSPIGKVKINERDVEQPVELCGLNHLDYMLLYKKFVTKQEPSYKLDDIGIRYVKLGKVEYEGSLDRLFREDVNKFIEYNIRDVEIIIKLEEKFKFIELTIAICHLCHVPYEEIYLSTVLNDGAILTYLKRKGIVSPNKPTTINRKIKEVEVGDSVKIGKYVEGELISIDDNLGTVKMKSGQIKIASLNEIRRNEGYAGGYLKEPVPGLYEWVIDLDFTSLYPSIIRSLNIGLETLVGNIVIKHKYDNNYTLADLKAKDPNELLTIEKLTEDRRTIQRQVPVKQIIDLVEGGDLLIAASGALFRTDKESIVCEVLSDWFDKRKEYKNLMKDAYKVKKDPELGSFYDKRQHAYKIKLNDVYGCFAINGWRYTDGHKIVSKAITLTGQRVTQESIKFVNKWLNERLGTDDKDYVVTSDTDSLFIQLKDLLLQKGIDLKDRETVVKATLEIATEIQKAANDHLNTLVIDLFNIRDRKHYFELKQEVVLERGYFAGKRRYAMFIINKEGVPVEELDMKGLDLMKSNMTPMYREFGEGLLKEIMFGKSKQEIDKKIIEFNKYVKTIPINVIAKPTGVKKMEEYIASKPRNGEIFSTLGLKCPINTKAAIFYNDLLTFKKLDKKYSKIVVGDKMKYIQLKPNPYKIDVIGFTGNDPEFITNFINDYADRDSGFESTLLNKLIGIYSDLSWDFPTLNEKVSKFFKF